MSTAPGWRLRTEHVTTFRYSSPVRASYNEVRKLPLTNARQTALEARVVTAPGVSQYAYRDYWGSQVVAFNVDGPHDELVVHGISLVETRLPADTAGVGWDEVGDAAHRFAELMCPSQYTEPDDGVRVAACSLRASTPRETVESIIGWVQDSLEYVRGVTHVHTAAAEALAAGRGVCQDFAHLALSTLRAVGIPARYVSGYLHPDPDAVVGAEAVGESHAWVEAWTGDWWGWDPTNGADVGPRHVIVARGRDYADVAPVRGIYGGSAEHNVSVSVRITRAA